MQLQFAAPSLQASWEQAVVLCWCLRRTMARMPYGLTASQSSHSFKLSPLQLEYSAPAVLSVLSVPPPSAPAGVPLASVLQWPHQGSIAPCCLLVSRRGRPPNPIRSTGLSRCRPQLAFSSSDETGRPTCQANQLGQMPTRASVL